MEIKTETKQEFNLDRRALDRSLSEILSEMLKLARGFFLKRKLDACDRQDVGFLQRIGAKRHHPFPVP